MSFRLQPSGRAAQMSRHYRVVLLVTLLFSLLHASDAFCPIKCHCDDGQLLADCTGGSLDLVPITLNPRLRELHLAANQIKSVKETLSFYNNLLLLDLNENQLQTLGERNFAQLKALKVLKVGSNRLGQLGNQTFAGLASLQQLYLPHNELRTVHSDVFRPLNRLRLLDASHNALASLPGDVFAALPTLELLNLSHNRFDNKLSALLFDRLASLKVLHMDHNSLQQLPDFLFRALGQLHTLTLNHCELRSLNRNLFFGLEGLKHLKLSHNQFGQLPPDAFANLENLEKLELQGTALLQLPNVFAPLRSIKHLSLGYDRFLKQLNGDLFNQNAKLQSIALEHCPSLEQLPIGLFNAQRQLALINLGQNALSTLQPNVFANYTLIQRLVLTGNPLNCDCNLAWLYSLHSLRDDKLVANNLIKKLAISVEDGEELERTIERWSGKEEDPSYANKHDKSLAISRHHHKSRNGDFKQHQRPTITGHLNEIDFNSAEYQDHLSNQFNNNQQFNHNNNQFNNNQQFSGNNHHVQFGGHHPNSNYLGDHESDQSDYLSRDQAAEVANHHHHQTQTGSAITATCFEPLSLVGRPLIELTAAELACSPQQIEHQSIMINGEKINFENRNPAMVVGYEEQYPPNNNRGDPFSSDDPLSNSSTSSGLNSFTLCFISVFAVCLVLFVIVFSFIYLRRHRKAHQQSSISSWILKPGASNNATLPFQPFASFDMTAEHLSQPKCNTLVNPLAKLGPLPKKPPANGASISQNCNLLIQNSPNLNSSTLNSSLNSSPNINYGHYPANYGGSNYTSNSTLNSKIKLTPQITRIANLANPNGRPNSGGSNAAADLSKLYEQVDYTGFVEQEQIYEDPLVDDLSDLNDLNASNSYAYQQLNSNTSTASSYLSNGLNPPTTYEEFLATSLMRSAPNSYGTLSSTLNAMQSNRLINGNINNLNSNNFNRTNSNSRRTLNTMAHL